MFKQLALICIVALGLEALWLATYRFSPLRAHTTAFVCLMLTAFFLCLWSFFRLPVASQKAALLVVCWGLLFRMTVLPAHPDQSEDVYRYLWDGRLSSVEIDPFRYPPEAPELANLRDKELYPNLNSKPYRSVYPPVSQMLFRLSYEMFGTRTTAVKAVFSLQEFGAVLLAWRLLTVFGCGLQTLYLLAWNPLFIFEFSHSGHSDSSMMFFTLMAVYLLHLSKNYWAMVSYAGSVLTKLYPALWLPLYCRLVGWRATAIGIAAGIALFSAYFTPKSFIEYLAALGVYLRPFEFNSGIHYLLGYVGREAFGQTWNQMTGPYLGAAALVISLTIACRFPVRKPQDILHAGFWVMTAILCLATTVHPWYLSWPGLALPFFPYAFMIYWTGASFLSYIAYDRNPVTEQSWVLIAQYLPMYILMACEIRHRGPILKSWLKHSQESRKERPGF